MSSDELSWLGAWLESRCDDRWEHDFGVRIESIDNPGWWVKIDLSKESPEHRVAVELLREGDAPDQSPRNVGGKRWIVCKVADGRFDGAGDPTQLGRIIRCFRDLIES